MKNKFKSLITVLLVVVGVFTLTACGKSLDKTLTDGTGTWQCDMSNGKNAKMTFFKNGNVTIEEKKSSENANYKIDGANINFVDDKDKIITSIENAKIDGDTIKGTLTSINFKNNKKIDIIMNKVK